MQISTFMIADELFALPALQVEEFFRPLPVTRVYGADYRIDGLVNIRGRTAIVINMRRCLGLQPLVNGESSEMILLETTAGLVEEAINLELYAFEEPIVLSVDSVSHIHHMDGNEVHPPPAHVNQKFIDGVVQNEKNYFTLISVKKLVDEILSNQIEVAQ